MKIFVANIPQNTYIYTCKNDHYKDITPDFNNNKYN